MSGGTGNPVTMSGTATATETFVTLTSPWRKGAPNSNGTAPTPKARATWMREVRISNNDAANVLLIRVNRSLAQLSLKAGTTLVLEKTVISSISMQSAAGAAWDIIAVAV